MHKLISVPTRITCKNQPERFTQQGIIDVGLSRKISRNKRGTHKHVKFWVNLLEETLTSITFSNYQNFNDATEECHDFIQKIIVEIIVEVIPIEERRIKHDSQECFDNGVSEAIKNRDKLFKKFIKILDYI